MHLGRHAHARTARLASDVQTKPIKRAQVILQLTGGRRCVMRGGRVSHHRIGSAGCTPSQQLNQRAPQCFTCLQPSARVMRSCVAQGTSPGNCASSSPSTASPTSGGGSPAASGCHPAEASHCSDGAAAAATRSKVARAATATAVSEPRIFLGGPKERRQAASAARRCCTHCARTAGVLQVRTHKALQLCHPCEYD